MRNKKKEAIRKERGVGTMEHEFKAFCGRVTPPKFEL